MPWLLAVLPRGERGGEVRKQKATFQSARSKTTLGRINGLMCSDRCIKRYQATENDIKNYEGEHENGKWQERECNEAVIKVARG